MINDDGVAEVEEGCNGDDNFEVKGSDRD